MRSDYPFDIKVSGDLFSDPETTATVLHMMVLAAYGEAIYAGDEYMDGPIDPVDLWLSIKEDFRAVVPEENENKLNAIMFAVSTDAFYEDPLAFYSICQSLYTGDLGDLVDGQMDDLTIPELLWGIYEVELNRDDKVEFAPGIERLIDEVISEEAEDLSEMQESRIIPYYEQFVAEMRNDMFDQMRKLGVSEKILRKIALADLTPAHDDEEEQESEKVYPWREEGNQPLAV